MVTPNQTEEPLACSLTSIDKLGSRLSSPRRIAIERIKALETTSGEDGCGLASPMVRILCDAADAWTSSITMRGRQFVGEMVMKHHERNGFIPHRMSEEKKDDESTTDAVSLSTNKASAGSNGHNQLLASGTQETDTLHHALSLHLSVARVDPTLAEEMGRAGSHMILCRLARFDLYALLDSCISASGVELSAEAIVQEEDEDAVMELQDLACEIGSLSCGAFPMKYAPFTKEELIKRLPLKFAAKPVASDLSSAVIGQEDNGDSNNRNNDGQFVLIHQVTVRQSAQEDVGFVMWPSAVVLSSWVVSNPSIIRSKSVLELGAGCGLVGLVAAGIMYRDGGVQLSSAEQAAEISSHIILTDFNEIVLQNLDRNICLNDLSAVAVTEKLDFYAHSGEDHAGGWLDGAGTEHEPVDVVLAADVICKPADAVAAANTIYDCLKPGGYGYVVSADAMHRFGVEKFESECCRLGMSITITDVGDLYGGDLLSSSHSAGGLCGIEQTSGYVEGMALTMFHVVKPVAVTH